MMDHEEAERLIKYLTHKHVNAAHRSPRGVSNADIVGIVATTVADTLLVVDGKLKVEDFNPDAPGRVVPAFMPPGHRRCECLDPWHNGPCRNDANADEVIGGGLVASSPALCTACAFSCDEFDGPHKATTTGGSDGS